MFSELKQIQEEQRPKEIIQNKDTSFNPDTRLTNEIEKHEVNNVDTYDPDKRLDIYNSTFEERLEYVPKNPSILGEWNGDRGDSEFTPSDNYERGKIAIDKLAEYGETSVTYEKGVVDFSKFAEESVEIEEMTDNRYDSGGNFEQADTKCAEKWNAISKDGKNNWTARDVANYRHENNCSWHECSDMKTCQLVPREIHGYFTHSGGVFEYKKGLINDIGDEFDE